MVTQPRFREKSFYVKLTFSVARDIKFYTKMTQDYERQLKMKVRSRLTVFEILPTSTVICIWKIWHENETTRYFKNYSATNLTKTIVESLYKVLLATSNLTALKRPVFLLRALEFYATNNF